MSDCDKVKSLIQEALNQRGRHSQAVYSLSIFFEGDQTGAAEDYKIFLDMVRCLGSQGESLRIPLSSPGLGGPGWEVNDRVAALIKQGVQLDPKYGRVLLMLHYAGHGLVDDNGYLGESLDIFDCVPILDCCHSIHATRESNIQTRSAEVLSAVRDEQFARSQGVDSTGKVTTQSFTARFSALVSQQRGKGHESISFLDAVEELKTHSNQNRMPQFKMLFGSTFAIRVPLLPPSSTLVHGQSANLSAASLKQGDVTRAVFSVHIEKG